MLDKNNIQMFDQMMRKVFGEMIGVALRENNEIFGRQLKREMRDEMHSVVKAEVSASEKRIINEITDFIADNIVPQIDDHETRLLRLERKTA